MDLGRGQGSRERKFSPDYRDSESLIKEMIDVIGDNGNYMINVAPNERGKIDEAQVKIMDGFGQWMNKYGDAVYGTRAGIYRDGEKFISTRKAKKAWIFVKQGMTKVAVDKQTGLSLSKDLEQGEIRSVRLLNNNTACKIEQFDSKRVIHIPKVD